MGRKLTDKQKMFVAEYLVDLNATAAARRAGYSEKRASEIGHQLLQKTTVQEAIQVAMEKREKRVEITQDKVLQQLAKIAFADIKDMLSFKTVKTVDETVSALVGYPVLTYKQVVDLKDSDDVDGTLLAEVSETKEGLKIKRHDSLKALELLGKHLGMFTEKVELTGKEGGPVQFGVVALPDVDQE
ncbi:MAG: terminase small subunit [Bacillota bacterium]